MQKPTQYSHLDRSFSQEPNKPKPEASRRDFVRALAAIGGVAVAAPGLLQTERSLQAKKAMDPADYGVSGGLQGRAEDYVGRTAAHRAGREAVKWAFRAGGAEAIAPPSVEAVGMASQESAISPPQEGDQTFQHPGYSEPIDK